MQMRETRRNFFAWILIVGTVGIAFPACERRTAKISQCVVNLQHIRSFKELWEQDNDKSSNNVPTWDDLRPYFPTAWSNRIPVCPSGGTDSLGHVGQDPTCSIGGKGHSIR